MAEENKKGGFWASLFGRNKKQDEPKIEPIIEEEKITEKRLKMSSRLLKNLKLMI